MIVRCIAAVFILALTACQGGAGLQKLAPAQRQVVAQITRFLNRKEGFASSFVQTWPNGEQTSGRISYVPGRLHMVYDPPREMEAVAQGSQLVIKEAATQSKTTVGLSHNPLGMLLKTPVSLDEPVQVTSVQENGAGVQVSLADSANPSQGLLTLGFYRQGGRLIPAQIETVDARGNRNRFVLKP